MTSYNEPTPDFYCTDWSLAIGEPMGGTAVSCQHWFFLEYNQPWTAKATSDNNLPKNVQAWLDEQVERVNGRLQFIKQPRGTRTGWTFFVASFASVGSRIYRFELDNYEALLALDLSAILAGDTRYQSHLTSGSHLLVCTNGKRDVCCSLHGLALLRALSVYGQTAVWETTHLGGHRFASTLLTLPDGINYGRLTPQDVPQLQIHLQNRTLWLDKLRGRVCFDPVIQVAELFLRQETGENGQATYEHVATHMPTEDTWQVKFRSATGQQHLVTVAADPPLTTYPSSGQLTNKTFPQFRYEDHTLLAG